AARGDASEPATAQTAESDADASVVATSFSIVKVLVWAMPILGFIGTVIGISESMGGFSRSLDGAAEFDAIKGSLGDVTTGLALAFDTTLVALVASVFLMLPMSWISKAEEQVISDVDDYCVTKLLRRLASKEGAEGPADELGKVDALGLGADDVRKLILEALAAPVGEMLAANAKLMNRLVEDREAVEVAQTVLANHLSAFAAASHLLGPAVERAAAQLERATTQLEQATATIDRSASAAERTQTQLAKELGASRQLLSLLAAGLSASSVPVAAAKANGHAALDAE
ncbi:MAG: MotA/TolQ/ExbB proton channel family protein, partial [Myxococcales bacterium]|nr:MotA/TolQ/ExbB proton channel family protein [Myxococcales bacterium]